MKYSYSYKRATWWLVILTVPKPYDGVLYRTDSVGGRVGCFLLVDAIVGSLYEVIAIRGYSPSAE